MRLHDCKIKNHHLFIFQHAESYSKRKISIELEKTRRLLLLNLNFHASLQAKVQDDFKQTTKNNQNKQLYNSNIHYDNFYKFISNRKNYLKVEFLPRERSLEERLNIESMNKNK